MRTVHRVLAVTFGAWIVLQSLTGLVLVLQDRIDGWSRPELFHHGHGDLGPQAALDAAAKARPDTSPTGVTMPAAAGGVYVVAVGNDDVYVDPATGRTNGVRNVQEGFTATVLRWHQRLNQQRVFGYPASRLVGWLGLGWLAVTAAGVAAAFRRRRGGRARLVRFPARHARRKALPLHRSLGVIIALPVAIVVVTGVRYAMPAGTDKVWAAATGSGEESATMPPMDVAPLSTDIGDTPLTADAAILHIRFLFPEAKVTALAMPIKADRAGPIRADLSMGYDPARGRRGAGGNATLLLDQYDGRRLWLGRTAQLPALRQAITAWAPAVHTGTFAGGWSRAFLTVLALSVLTVAASGFRALAQRQSARARRTAPAPPPPSEALAL